MTPMTPEEVIEWLRACESESMDSGLPVDAAVHGRRAACVESLAAENARLAAPEAVEAKEIPDAPGIWSRDGVTYLFGYDDECRGPRALFVSESGVHDGYTYTLPKGGWLPCTVITPPAKSEPKRPLVLFGKAKDNVPQWFMQDGQYWRGVATGVTGWITSQLHAVDESASDKEAVELWRRETNQPALEGATRGE